MIRLFDKFWDWYERHKTLHTMLVAVLFGWQLWHLYWLTTHVVAQRLLGVSFFDPSPLVQWLILSADWAEIPALLSASLLYISELRHKFSWKPIAFLILINTQWLHILWITDEFVVSQFTGESLLSLPIWLAWIAIGIDYLELPVIYDTFRRVARRLISGEQLSG